MPFGKEKLEWSGYPMVMFDEMFSLFDRMPAYVSDRRTDKETDRHLATVCSLLFLFFLLLFLLQFVVNKDIQKVIIRFH